MGASRLLFPCFALLFSTNVSFAAKAKVVIRLLTVLLIVTVHFSHICAIFKVWFVLASSPARFPKTEGVCLRTFFLRASSEEEEKVQDKAEYCETFAIENKAGLCLC